LVAPLALGRADPLGPTTAQANNLGTRLHGAVGKGPSGSCQAPDHHQPSRTQRQRRAPSQPRQRPGTAQQPVSSPEPATDAA